MGSSKLGAVLLLVGGLVHMVPGLYTWLADLTGGTPWVQVVVGVMSVVVAISMFGAKDQAPAM
ncbi:MAG: hypothetical protein Q7S64_02135 [bacterium]|nr:hypothetical protein [bacterium]